MRILVIGAQAARTSFVAELARQCELVIAADGGGSACLAAGIVPDLLVGDLDSLDASDEDALRGAGVRFVTSPAEKDVTDLDLALDEARAAGAEEIWATGVLGGRLDHTLASIGSVSRHTVAHPRLIEPDINGWVLSPDGQAVVGLEGTGALLSLFALGGPARVSASGVKYPLFEEVLGYLDSRGISNLITSTSATIRVFEGTLLVLSNLAGGMLLAQERASESTTE